MKHLLFIWIACVVATFVGHAKSSDPDKEPMTLDGIRQSIQMCKEESGASDHDIEAIVQHKPADTRESKCLRACLLKRTGAMTPEGKMNKERSMALALLFAQNDPKAVKVVEDVVDSCLELHLDDDHCEAAVTIEKCLMEACSKSGVHLN